MNKKKRLFLGRIGAESWKILLILAGCGVVYYLPNIIGISGWPGLERSLNALHDFHGLDFYALVFFIPVVYAAYTVGVFGALVTTMMVIGMLMPYAMSDTFFPDTVFRPTAFAIILSAVGAIVAMLQKNDLQRQQNVKDLKCLYEIGQSAEKSKSVREFVSSLVNIIPRYMRHRGHIEIRITAQGEVFASSEFKEVPERLILGLNTSNESPGALEIYSLNDNMYLQTRQEYLKTLTERISSAIREIELQVSLEKYYEQMEDMVEKRTHDLELTQEKLIRAERLAAVGELASGVGHELRNPLNVIRNCAYLLNLSLEGKLDEETANTLKLLDRQVDISNRIVSDLLDFTRVKQPVQARIDLNSLVKESLTWVVAPKEAAVLTALDASSPQVWVDAEQIGRAFANVIVNAYQAMNGSGQLHINTGRNGEYAWASFEDSGSGISPENMKRLFEPLFTTKSRGIGLGLAITKRLVEQNLGWIDVKSQVDKGTTFTIKLPLVKEKHDGTN